MRGGFLSHDLMCAYLCKFGKFNLQVGNLTKLAHIKMRIWTIPGNTQQKQGLSFPNQPLVFLIVRSVTHFYVLSAGYKVHRVI